MKRKIKMVEQTEHSECGLACATMILNYEGINISLNEIRDTFGVPRGGISLYHLIQVMTAYGIKCKAYEILDIYSLRTISTPFICLWEKKRKRLNFRYDRKNPRLLSSSRSTLTIHI